MKLMSPFDAAWLQVDSRETPMQVGSLQIYAPPDGAPDDHLARLVARLKNERAFVAPWNQKLQSPALKLLPAWTIDDGLDLDYHVRHSALPRPGGERELGMLISRLHSHPLDLTRPPWEVHVIEGLEGGRFAMYCKLHHALIDGVGAMRMLMRIMSSDPSARDMPAPWTVGPRRPPPAEAGPAAATTLADALRAQARSLPQALSAIGDLLLGGSDAGDALVPPFAGPRSILNRRVTAQRRFATQRYPLARLRAVARAADCTVNDVVLYLTGTALRRFLGEAGALPDTALTAGIPVNVRPAGDESAGTAISFIIATLATDIEEPRRRLDAITASTRRAKEHLSRLPRAALTQYTLLSMAPYILQLLSGLGGRTRPVFNVTISNVPGPEHALYFDGAKQEALYPVSLIAHGIALNVTCVSYDGSLSFGFTGCRDTVPHMQNLAVYAGAALDEIELALAA
jgi:diacylglycerol O-acyltransferase / wax synthase